jgi:PAS domain S-box-containing protein
VVTDRCSLRQVCYSSNKLPTRERHSMTNETGPKAGPADVADEPLALKRLRESEERLQFVAERAEVGSWYWKLEPDQLEWTPQCKKLFGIPAGEAMSYVRFLEAVHPEDRGRTDNAVRACLEGSGETDYDIEYRTLWSDGSVRWIHAKGSAVFRNNKPVRMAGIAIDITARKQADEALRQSELRYRQLVEQMTDGIFVTNSEGRLVDVSSAGCAMLGAAREELLGKHISDLAMPEEHHRIAPEIVRYDDGGIYTSEWRVRRKDGSAFICEVVGRKLANGNLQAVARDITERKRQEEQIHILTREVNHRSKNMLSVVQAIARQTLAANPEDFLDRFGKRVEALAASQDLLVKNAWKGADLNELVRSQLGHFGELIGTRIRLEGLAVFVSASAAQVIGMALHELATNAGKFGALSGAEGRVDIGWCVRRNKRDEEMFTISWCEHCSNPIMAPSKEGFGSSVISRMVELSLGAKVALSYPATGLIWELSCAAGEALEDSVRPAAIVKGESSASAGNHTRTDQRPRILVVEDEALVATEIAHALTEAGFDVVGPARNVQAALGLLERWGCDAAVLDVNLGRETSEAVAIELASNKTPFVILSGYSLEQYHPVFAGASALRKPLRLRFLIDELRKCVGENGDGCVRRPAQ